MQQDSSRIKQDLMAAYNQKVQERDSQPKEAWKLDDRQQFLQVMQAQGAERLLEIGAGSGQDSVFFRDHGLRVTCIDLSAAMVAHCIEKSLDAREMDFSQLDFADASFDAVWALNCLLHVPKSEIHEVLQEVRRVLRPGGVFYLGIHGGIDSEGIWEDDDYEPKRFFSLFTDESLQDLVRPYFEILEFKKIARPGVLDFQSLLLNKPSC
ncbi:MAG: hypothetical protein A2201_07295 [Alicyclobacillus sp. RIFOXYA1_FULL_53_8]|nr:MAG: hypothetical protein A2201_07295 [Alicyclobacillus sp. RIFOXYA1_FULL_53_8]